MEPNQLLIMDFTLKEKAKKAWSKLGLSIATKEELLDQKQNLFTPTLFFI